MPRCAPRRWASTACGSTTTSSRPGASRRSPTFDALTTLAAIATLTHRVRLGTVVLSASVPAAPVAAKMLTIIDVLSGGRLVVGLGSARTSPSTARSTSRSPRPPSAPRGCARPSRRCARCSPGGPTRGGARPAAAEQPPPRPPRRAADLARGPPPAPAAPGRRAGRRHRGGVPRARGRRAPARGRRGGASGGRPAAALVRLLHVRAPGARRARRPSRWVAAEAATLGTTPAR